MPRLPDTDVVVVGAGAGGLAAAWRLTTAGARVVLLEAGRVYRPGTDYPQTSGDFELREFPYDASRDAGGRARYDFGPAQPLEREWDRYRSWNAGQGRFVQGDERVYQVYSHVQGVGGSTLHFQGEAHRFHPDSLRMHSLFGVGTDWPIPHRELETYYAAAEERMGVAAPVNPLRPGGGPHILPPHPLSFASARLAKGFAAVGATLLPNSLAILSRPTADRPQCNYCGGCTQGCPTGDKGSADVTFLPPARATGRLDLRTRAQAVDVELDARGRAEAVVYADPAGARHRVSGRFVILAGGAIETPRLLLACRPKGHREGLANGSGQVGRHLTETLSWSTVGLLPERVDSWRGVAIDGSAWEHAVPKRGDGWAGGFRLATCSNAMGLRGPAAYAERLVPGFGSTHRRRLREVFGHAVAVLAVGEWLPNDRTYVDLSPSLRDAHGMARARIRSWLSPAERALVRTMAETVRELMRAAGASEIVEETTSLDLFAATHVLGTCRMGMDPAASVADRDGFSHEVPNLAFADASVVPSSGCGDSPCLTITALAIRTADRLLERGRVNATAARVDTASGGA
jgi:choline dehydrogenase-like flavoprotein